MQPQSTSAGAKWGPTSMGMESHIAAGLSYFFSPILPLIFFGLEKRNRFVRFHAMQSVILGVFAILWYIVVGLILPFIVSIIGTSADTATSSTGAISGGATLLSCGVSCLTWMGGFAFFTDWLWGIISAFTGKYTKLPIVGNLAEKWSGGPVAPMY